MSQAYAPGTLTILALQLVEQIDVVRASLDPAG
jgi:hypothetical protein